MVKRVLFDWDTILRSRGHKTYYKSDALTLSYRGTNYRNIQLVNIERGQHHREFLCLVI